MTTYLTKQADGKIYHFRVTMEHNGVSIVQGVFYHWLSKHFEGCGNEEDAIKKEKELIATKMEEGYGITEFKEIPENTEDIYDKAKWHYGGDFPEDLDTFQGFVHTGMFLGWLIESDLMSHEFKEDFEDLINKFKQRELTGPQIFESMDGVLSLEEISETGNRFALKYFDFSHGQYLTDYDNTIASGLPTMYHVKDTWENYERLKAVIDQRFDIWKREN